MKDFKNIFRLNPYITTTVTKVLYSGLMFLANAILTRYLGVEYRGEYTWFISVSSIVSIILGLGVYQSIPFYNRKDSNHIVEEYTNIFTFQFLINIILGLTISVLSKSTTILIIVLLAVFEILSQQLSFLTLITSINRRNAIMVNGAAINIIVIIIAFFILKRSLIIGIILTLILKIYYIISYLRLTRVLPKPFSIKANRVIEKVKFGLLPMLSYLLLTFNYKIDVIMLKSAKEVSPIELSYYSVGVTLAELGWLLPDVFKEVLFSRTAQEDAYSEIVSAIRVSNLFSGLLIVGVALLGKPAIMLFYGKEFGSSYIVTVLLFCGIPSMSWFKIIYTLYTAQGKTKFGFTVLGFSAIINIVMNLLLIPIYGIMGATVASILSYTFCGTIYLVSYSKKIKVKWYEFFGLSKSDFNIFKRENT